ncbi:MAG: hypothetical protein HQL67_03815 [Magnetococcales bacterium]|nr:hypothetical protein [Magnetococcales bacterium]
MLPLLIPAGLSAALGVVIGKKMANFSRRGLRLGKLSDSFGQTVSVEIVKERILRDETLILAIEEVPLDNRFGVENFSSDHEFIRSATISLDIERSREVGSSIRTNLWQVLESKVSGELSRSLGVRMGSQLTRRVRLSFSVAPKRSVNYRIIWKQESRRGEFDVRIANKRNYTIPYMVTYGLSHSVESADGGRFTEKVEQVKAKKWRGGS